MHMCEFRPGSIRIPASYCGILGFRPTHGRVSLQGCRPLAESFDTCGWFARDAQTLRRVGGALLGMGESHEKPVVRFRHMLIGEDAFGITDPACAAALREVSYLFQNMISFEWLMEEWDVTSPGHTGGYRTAGHNLCWSVTILLPAQ